MPLFQPSHVARPEAAAQGTPEALLSLRLKGLSNTSNSGAAPRSIMLQAAW